MVATLAGTGCYRVPSGKTAIATVEVVGAASIDHEDLEGRITTRATPEFLGLFYGIYYEYELFDRYALRRDLARVERYMKARGFYEAQVRVARVEPEGNKVHVTIEVTEGPPVLVDVIELPDEASIDEKTRQELRAAVEAVLPKGAKLDEDKLDEAEIAAVKLLTSRGHANARVARHAEVDLATSTAKLTFTVTPGPLAHIGKIAVKGLQQLPEDKVRTIFAVKEGDLYSSEEIASARQALLDLGVFASVEVTPDLTKVEEEPHIVPLQVTCEVSKLRLLLTGGGFEFDSLKTDLHATVGWQSSNFLGGLRRLDVKEKPGIVLYPTRFPSVQLPDKILFENRLNATLSQPAFLEARTTGVARVDYSIYPVLLPGSTSHNVIGYHEVRGTVGLERMFWNHLLINPQYGAQANFPFDYLGKTPDALTLLISYVDLFTYLDFRDDPVHTRKGIYVGNQLQVAGGPFQGDASDVRDQPEVRAYVPLTKHLVLALRGSVGFLMPFDYGKYAEVNFKNPGSSRIAGSERDYQILYFRGFYSGGPSTNRGYPLRGIGPYDLIPYLSPAGQSVAASGCNPNDTSCSLPTGGRSLWESSVELRYSFTESWSVAAFCDAADVSPFALDLRFDRPHLSCGAGGRYDTPVGPIRLDIGYRIPGLQTPKNASFERTPDTLFGFPIALAFGIGEAF
ncbi:MAG: outer membrane protein assembly factor YaeT precursor [Labilithrix sp.]|nr:outer membrane protein assembly factor YaeT precursor [Labilithrix sp.]